MNIGLLSISDRASAGDYQDRGISSLREWLMRVLTSPWEPITALVPDERGEIEEALIQLADGDDCALILTTGGTGPAARDVTPEATMAVADKHLPGFGEAMRAVSLRYVPTAILSRQCAVIRRRCLIINLPGQPKAIGETLEGVFSAVPYCLDLIGRCGMETDAAVIKAYRPAGAGGGA